ncbi:uncharacterized protein B0H64DRAFT_55238 [Chaetomium fimeti]|uniref:Uncharacterized protein n=1 Tax=Chaetomium fimeti TaxID=1854472 RepID=A0AAE0LMW8_9PEZI|nr:hypothetical protein B0H64DRAFT_55238 [Chaetomium fimeti]
MRTPLPLLLALAGFPAAVLAEDTTLIDGHLSGPVENEHSGDLNLVERYPLPEPQCGSWVGVEVIFMVEVTEVCPEGSTVTETYTQCVETLTRSICATAMTNRPCYPCIMGTPPPSDTATVTMTSCATATEQTLTVTVQLCSTCTTATYVGPIPGYTPGGPCHGCTPYGSGSDSGLSSSCSEEGGSATPAITTTTTSTSTITVSVSGCVESDVSSTRSTPPGNPSVSLTTSPTNTPYRPTTAPPAVTAGGVRNGVVGFEALIVSWVMMCAFLGM